MRLGLVNLHLGLRLLHEGCGSGVRLWLLRLQHRLFHLRRNLAEELVGVLEPCGLDEPTQGVAVLAWGHERVSHAHLGKNLLLLLQDCGHHRHLLLTVTSTQTDVYRQVVLVTPLSRVDSHELATHPHNSFLVLILADKVQDGLEQVFYPCLGKYPSNQLNLCGSCVLNHSHGCRGSVLQDVGV